MRKKIEDLFQRKQSYNSIHSLSTSIESHSSEREEGVSIDVVLRSSGEAQVRDAEGVGGAGKKWFTISEGWQTTNPSIPLVVVQPLKF